MTNTLFISYRRNDSAGYTRALYETLVSHYGTKNIFMDVESIGYGDDFPETIDQAAGKCLAMLAVIGPNWISIKDSNDNRRLDDSNDFVRREITIALKRKIKIIPVLVDNARMPDESDLPDDLKPLCTRNAIELSHLKFTADTIALIENLSETIQSEILLGSDSHSTISANKSPGSISVVGNVTIGGNYNVHQTFNSDTQKHIDNAIKYYTKEIDENKLALKQRDEQISMLTDAITNLAAQKDNPTAPAGIDEALTMLEQGNSEQAEAIFQTILDNKAIEGKSANQEAATAAQHLGTLSYYKDTEKALAAFIRVTELNPRSPSGWDNLGHLLKRVGDYKGSERAYFELLKLGETIENESIVASSFTNLGNLYQAHGQIDKAKEMHLKALDIYEQIDFKRGMAAVYGNLGIIYIIQGEPHYAKEMHKKALAIHIDQDNKLGITNARNNLGNVYLSLSEFEKAITHYKKALNIAISLENYESMAKAYSNLGNVYMSIDEMDLAQEMNQRSLEINEKLGRKEGIAKASGNLGIISFENGDLENAEAMQKKALAIHKKLGRNEGMANTYLNLGQIYCDRGGLDLAEEMYRNALTINEELGRKESIAKVLISMGILHKTKREYEDAEKLYRQSLEIFTVLKQKEGIAIALTNIGIVNAIRSNYIDAKTMFEKALAHYCPVKTSIKRNKYNAHNKLQHI